MTAPFYRYPVDAAGALPDDPELWDDWPARFWMGQPGRMIELPSPDPANYTSEASRGRVEHGLASNASGLTQYGGATRHWGLSWQRLSPRDFDRLKALDAGLYGDELVYVQPEDRNHLTLAQSMCGALGMTGWSATNPPIYDPTLTPPIDPSGVFRWTPASSGDRLTPNATGSVPDVDHACPNLPAEPMSWSLWARADSGTVTVTPRLLGVSVSGSPSTTITAPSVTVGGSWVLVQMAVQPGALLTAPYVLPTLASSGVVQIACAQFEYRDFRTEWTAGGGCPRVIMPGTLPRQLDVFRNSGLPVTLAESVTGAC